MLPSNRLENPSILLFMVEEGSRQKFLIFIFEMLFMFIGPPAYCLSRD